MSVINNDENPDTKTLIVITSCPDVNFIINLWKYNNLHVNSCKVGNYY